jgi:hypothetical protein
MRYTKGLIDIMGKDKAAVYLGKTRTAAWTPERRAAQSKRMRTRARIASAIGPIGEPEKRVPIPVIEKKWMLSSLKRAEGRLAAKSSGETVVIFDAQGKGLFAARTTSLSFTPTAEEQRQMIGSILTHNHPNRDSVSVPDIQLAHSLDVREIRAVVGARVYSVRPPNGGWGSRADLDLAINDAINCWLKANQGREWSAKFNHDIAIALDRRGVLRYTVSKR